MKILALLLVLMPIGSVLAAEPAKPKQPAPQAVPVAPAATAEQKLDVNAMRTKYWARGEEGELRVVQNRLYSKAGKIEIGLFGGTISTDPFLSVRNLGGSIGFHLSEYFGINLTGWKSYVSSSSALTTFEKETGTTTNSNYPRSFWGLEVGFSPIYGKLSLLGQAIIYYDLHLLGGGGSTQTESGNYVTPLMGIGQQIYLTKAISFRADFRTTYYKEAVLQKVDRARLGQVLGTRSNWSNIVTVGFTFLIGVLD